MTQNQGQENDSPPHERNRSLAHDLEAPDLDALRAIVSEWRPDTPGTIASRWFRYARHRIRPNIADLPSQDGPFASGTPRGFSFQAESRRRRTGTRSRRRHSVMSDVAPWVTSTGLGPVIPNIVPSDMPIMGLPRADRRGSNGRQAVDDYFGLSEIVERVGTRGTDVGIYVECREMSDSDASSEESGPRCELSAPAAAGRINGTAYFARLLRRSKGETAELGQRCDPRAPADHGRVGHGTHSPPLEQDGKRTPRSVIRQREAGPIRSRLNGYIGKFQGLKPMCIDCTLDNGKGDYERYPSGCLPERPKPCCKRAFKKLRFFDAALYHYWAGMPLNPEDFLENESSDPKEPRLEDLALHRCPHLTPHTREHAVWPDERRSSSHFCKECWAWIRCRCGGIIQGFGKRIPKTQEQQKETFDERLRRQGIEEEYSFLNPRHSSHTSSSANNRQAIPGGPQ